MILRPVHQPDFTIHANLSLAFVPPIFLFVFIYSKCVALAASFPAFFNAINLHHDAGRAASTERRRPRRRADTTARYHRQHRAPSAQEGGNDHRTSVSGTPTPIAYPHCHNTGFLCSRPWLALRHWRNPCFNQPSAGDVTSCHWKRRCPRRFVSQ